jgi:hypothetical protein
VPLERKKGRKEGRKKERKKGRKKQCVGFLKKFCFVTLWYIGCVQLKFMAMQKHPTATVHGY